ncbi:hypothetical protein O181_058950 [Austropuccinia psidii MF-1]|uniref:Uncharacterized protein n=1 Tax=Austropuccinia psidii MF-1 TaxID=1389203 RepID=A0A9Q3HYB3_9BASI|nr:hypothetical protein [Austropuccinia psidii MF-1]
MPGDTFFRELRPSPPPPAQRFVQFTGPVSAFSPVTPFQPVPPSSSGYFDRPSTSSSSLSACTPNRPKMQRLGNLNSFFFMGHRGKEMSPDEVAPPENGWKMASRIRDEALSTWCARSGNVLLNPKDMVLQRKKRENAQPSHRCAINELQCDSGQPELKEY